MSAAALSQFSETFWRLQFWRQAFDLATARQSDAEITQAARLIAEYETQFAAERMEGAAS